MNENEVKQLVSDIQDGVKTAILPAVTEEVVKAVNEKIAARKDIFGGGDANAEVKEQREKSVEYVKKLAAKQDTKGLSAGTSGAGLELVPTYVSSEVVRVAEKYGLVRKYARKWPMQGVNTDVPTLTSVSAYRVNEGAKVTSSKPTSGNVQLRAKTVGVLIPITKKLLLGATVELVDALNALAGEAIAKLEDQWALLGLTAGEGVFQHASVTGVTLSAGNTTYNKAVAEDLLDTIDKVDENIGEDSLRWVMSRSVLNVFRKLRAAVGADKQGFLFEGFGGQLPPTMWDIPYSLSPIMPKTSAGSQAGTKFIALADFSGIILGDALSYTMELSDQATITDTDGTTLINLFEQNQVGLKITGEIDIQLAQPASRFAWIKTAAV